MAKYASMDKSVHKRKAWYANAKKNGALFYPRTKIPHEKPWWESSQHTPGDPNAPAPIQQLENEPLPYGAIGKDRFDRPYYGGQSILQEWWRRMVATFNAPVEGTSGGILDIRSRATRERVYSGFSPYEYLDVGGTLANLGNKMQNFGDPGKNPTGITYFGRAIKGLLEGIFATAQEGTQQFKQTLGAGYQFEAAGLSPTLESPLPLPTSKAWEDYISWTPIGRLYSASRYLFSNTTWEEKKKTIESGYNAGRVLYTSIFEPAVRADYLRQYQSGANPYLLGLKLQNPLIEAAGEALLDPLNVVGGFMSHARDIRRIESAKDALLRVPEALEVATRGGEVVTDGKIAENLGNFVKSYMMESQRVVGGLDELARSQGISQLTNTGKRFIVGREMAEITDFIWRGVKGNVDDAMEFLKGMVQAASTDPDEVLTGVQTLARFPTTNRPFFSRAGMRMSYVIRQALVDEKGLLNTEGFMKSLTAAAKEGTPAVVKLFDNKVGKVLDSVFPTIAERIARGEEVSPWLRSVSRFHEIMYEKGPYRFFNTFFAGIYMGLNPGYAFRNAWTNMFQTLVDEGPAVAFVSPTKAMLRGQAWNGGTPLRGALGFGGVAAGEAAGQVLKGNIAGTGIRLADAAETGSAKQIVGSVFVRTMKDVLRHDRDLALPAIDEIVAAGAPRSAAASLKAKIFSYAGDVEKGVAEWLKEFRTGIVDQFRDMGWVKHADIQIMDDFGLTDHVADAVRNGADKDSVINGINNVFDELIQTGDGVVDDISAISKDNTASEAIQTMADAVRNKHISNEELELAQDYFEANHQSNMAWEDLLRRTFNEAAFTLSSRGVNPEEVRSTIGAIMRKALVSEGDDIVTGEDLINGAFATQAKRASKSLSDQTWVYHKAIDIAQTPEELAKIWNEARLPGKFPTTPIKAEIKTLLWQTYRKLQRDFWVLYRDQNAKFSMGLIDELSKITGNAVDARQAEFLTARAAKYDGFAAEAETWFEIRKAIQSGNNANAAAAYARQFGISTATEAGHKLDNSKILNIVNKYSGQSFTELAEVPPEVSRKALLRYAVESAEKGETPIAEVEAAISKQAPLKKPQITPDMKPYPGGAPSFARTVYEQKGGLNELRQRLIGGVNANWGKSQGVAFNPEVEKAVMAWGKVATQRVEQARLISQRVAIAARDFVLHAYPAKTNFDLVKSYLMPYHFWYSRTYVNWMRRIAMEPEVISKYAIYKDTLAKIHGDMPEWWRYQLNSNDLPGVHTDKPWFANLEATLWPLNGLTGVDFNDPRKRVNWVTSVLDDIGKFGPSVFTPFQIATAIALYHNGEKDAAARWGGRLFPQTAAFKSLTALLGVPGGWEIDPMVLIFSGGMDVYEQRQVGRALGTLVEQGKYTQAQTEEAMMTKQGQIWDEGRALAQAGRAPGNIMSFLLGAGFRTRSVQDMQIDQMDEYLARFYDIEEDLTPEEVSNTFEWMRTQFPFFDTVIMSRKSGDERNRIYAYSVIGRIPPGQKDDLFKAVGVSPALFDKFYDTKGRIWNWAPGDQKAFMSAVMDIGALLEVPDQASRGEWREASKLRQQVETDIKTRFGADITELMDEYYALRRTNLDTAQDFMDANPVIGDALDFRTQQIMGNDLLKKYYASTDTVRSFFRSQMFDAIEAKVGSDIWKKWDKYDELQLTDSKAAYRYYKAHPELKEYSRLRNMYDALIAEQLAHIEQYLPDRPYPFMRPDLPENMSTAQQAALQAVNKPREAEQARWTWQQWKQTISPALQNLVIDHVVQGKPLSYAARRRLEQSAENLGIDPDYMLALMERQIRGQR